MKQSEPLHLIIADPSPNVAEELINELRNEGLLVRAQHVDSGEALNKALTSKDWGLVVCRRDEEMAYSPEDLILLARQADADFPVLLLEDGVEIERLTEGLELGATDVLLAGEDQRLLLVLRRELNNLTARRDKRRAELAMEESERRNQLLLDTSRAAIAYIHEGMHVYVNKTYAALFGYEDMDDLAAIPLLDMITSDFLNPVKQRLKQFDAGKPAEGFTIEGLRRDSSTFQGEMSLSVAAFDGEPCMQVLIRQDAASPQAAPDKPGAATTAASAPQSQSSDELCARDLVPGFVRQAVFISTVGRAVKNAKEGQGGSALFKISLDDMDRIRSEAGNSGTEQVQRDTGQALASVCGQHAVLAQLSESSFTVLLQNLSSKAARELAERIRAGLQALLASAGKKTIRLTASIGILLIGSKMGSAETAMEQVALTIDHLNRQYPQGNAIYLYDRLDFITAPNSKGPADDEKARVTLRLLINGIESNSLVLLHQPIICLHGEQREHYEIYLRLPDESGGMLRPDQFIEIAEHVGVGGLVDRWVIRKAIQDVARRRAQGHNACVTINLTHAALTDDAFLPWLREALKAAKLPKDVVILQYSETAATTYLQRAKTFGQAVAQLHCRLGLSHFGSSENSFEILQHLSIDFVKLDGSFVKEIGSSPEKQAALFELVQELDDQDKHTIVPMVDTANVLALLYTSRANYVQGYYLGEPTPEMNFDFDALGF